VKQYSTDFVLCLCEREKGALFALNVFFRKIVKFACIKKKEYVFFIKP